jgi:D-alanyl-D-alanine carboxypeptidase
VPVPARTWVCPGDWAGGLRVLLIAGCATTASSPSTASAPAGTPSDSSPVKTIDLAALRATVDATAKELLVPGAVVEVRTPQGFHGCRRHEATGADMPPGGDTHFRIASITKTMTAAVIVLLAQAGKLQFSDPVSKYLPNVPNGENITIAELLKMRSGRQAHRADRPNSCSLPARPRRSRHTSVFRRDSPQTLSAASNPAPWSTK